MGVIWGGFFASARALQKSIVAFFAFRQSKGKKHKMVPPPRPDRVLRRPRHQVIAAHLIVVPLTREMTGASWANLPDHCLPSVCEQAVSFRSERTRETRQHILLAECAKLQSSSKQSIQPTPLKLDISRSPLTAPPRRLGRRKACVGCTIA